MEGGLQTLLVVRCSSEREYTQTVYYINLWFVSQP